MPGCDTSVASKFTCNPRNHLSCSIIFSQNCQSNNYGTLDENAENKARYPRTPREEKQGWCRSMGQRKWLATHLPERGKENARAVTGLEQRNALARPLLPPDGVVGREFPLRGMQGA
jgi:hypothetical protein